MEPISLRSMPWLLAILLVPSFLFGNYPENFDATKIRTGVESMECIVKPICTAEVERYIRRHLSMNGRSTARVIARAATYFPVFEEYLEKLEMPSDLKYLAVVESALNPIARSPVGAGGLWQFMSETGRLYGLTINKVVDERSCPHRATKAAMQHLHNLYERFGTWELALAAYNAGAGTVLRAQKRARSNDYWAVARYLPIETRNFVPAFIGINYLFRHYQQHGVQPEFPHLDLQLTEAIKVFQPFDFSTIAAVTGLPLAVVIQLNPHFKRKNIPANPNGFYLTLPSRVIPAMQDYLVMLRPDAGNEVDGLELPTMVDSAQYYSVNYYHSANYQVREGDKLAGLVKLFNCSVYSLRIWNGLQTNQIKKGQLLTVWFPSEMRHFGREVIAVVAKPPKVLLPERPTIQVPPNLPMVTNLSKAQLSMPTATPQTYLVWTDSTVLSAQLASKKFGKRRNKKGLKKGVSKLLQKVSDRWGV